MFLVLPPSLQLAEGIVSFILLFAYSENPILFFNFTLLFLLCWKLVVIKFGFHFEFIFIHEKNGGKLTLFSLSI